MKNTNNLKATDAPVIPLIIIRADENAVKECKGVLKKMKVPTYVYECSICRRHFSQDTQKATLSSHQNLSGKSCYGRYGVLIRVDWQEV